MEKPESVLDTNPNICLACAAWSDQVENPITELPQSPGITDPVSHPNWDPLSRRRAA